MVSISLEVSHCSNLGYLHGGYVRHLRDMQVQQSLGICRGFVPGPTTDTQMHQCSNPLHEFKQQQQWAGEMAESAKCFLNKPKDAHLMLSTHRKIQV